MSDTRFSDEQFGRVEAICAEHFDRPWATKDSMERELMSVAVVNMPNMIAEIRRLRAENERLRNEIIVASDAWREHSKATIEWQNRTSEKLEAMIAKLPPHDRPHLQQS